MSNPSSISVLIPAKDEAENLEELLRQCSASLPTIGQSWEVVIVDDGSTDGTAELLRELSSTRPWLKVVTHRRQMGIAEALRSATDSSEGDILVFYPADLQYKPEDIASLVKPILDDTADIVTGSKQGQYEKQFVSSIYNGLCRWLFGVRVTDLNSVKAYRREVMANVPMRPDWHRFMVVIAAADGHRVSSVPVPLYQRSAGRSKFTWTRIPVGVLDLLSVWFQLRFGRKPMLFFGVFGAVLFSIGFLVGTLSVILRLVYKADVVLMVSLVQTMLITGVILFGFGLLGELIAGLREEQREISRLLRDRHR